MTTGEVNLSVGLIELSFGLGDRIEFLEKTQSLFPYIVFLAVNFNGCTTFSHRQSDANNVFDRFGYRPTPSYFTRRFKTSI